DTVLGWRFPNPAFPADYTIGLGETAEVVAKKYNVTREAQDRFALRSQQKAADAQQGCRFAAELTPVAIPQRRGEPVVVDLDEHPRPDTSLETPAKLRPAFRKDGTVTAGNSSGLNDGAAALLIVSEERMKSL